MILIDVIVPHLERTFDFEVDESMDVESLKDIIEGLIEENEKVRFSRNKRAMFFYRIGDFLNGNIPLVSQGVRNGDRLILV